MARRVVANFGVGVVGVGGVGRSTSIVFGSGGLYL